ncbi:addiction module toxin RelE [Sphingomonas sp. Leaf412]|uniref:type II toxin-antitoxin system RelE/ParE family toxin n=1 Tax=Sphingomonas sp. Leaf412 TaxID=1736370 RepID=UPI000701FC88|nr:type II toxin-antitoxin system RelE/ParE family toxin [Sphingomonas sp. Leaf412]KQT31402.1 addiction module toxin RelE [Sphingomonas sp. Leaf412]
MQAVIETSAYLAAAKDAGMTVEEQQAVVDLIAAKPDAGKIMPGCGGARKLRVARPGGGKSGGYRIITYYAGIDTPTFLITVFGKNEKTNLTKGERNALAVLTKTLTDSLARKT